MLNKLNTNYNNIKQYNFHLKLNLNRTIFPLNHSNFIAPIIDALISDL